LIGGHAREYPRPRRQIEPIAPNWHTLVTVKRRL
jgi:hypothetical protein